MEMAVHQANRSLIRPVTIAAALIGTIQALIWIGLSLVSILFYHSVILADDTLPSNSFRRVIYQIFLDVDFTYDEVIVTPKTFSIFMYVYAVLSFVWLITSLYMLWAMTRNKWSDGYALVRLWSMITILISILDIILMSLVAADFVTVQDMFNPSIPVTTTEAPFTTTIITQTLPTAISQAPITDETTDPSPSSPSITNAPEIDPAAQLFVASTNDTVQKLIFADDNAEGFLELDAVKNLVYTAYGTVISLAARGYILWIVNIVFVVILFKFAHDLEKEAAPSLLPYATSGGRPWSNLYEQTDIGSGYSNSGFKEDNDQAMFPRSDSFIADPEIKNRNPLSNGGNPYTQSPDRNPNYPPNPNVVNGRVAKIGKSGGRRTPPQNIPPPNVPIGVHIPDPDYTPPTSPMPKSVLRPKSNYVL